MLSAPVTAFTLRPSALSKTFWDGAMQGKLLVQRCNDCRQPFFIPEFACTHCGSDAWQWTESSGRGTLYSFSIIHRPPAAGFSVPYVFAIVELDEGWVMLSNLVGVEAEQVRIGMRLEVAFQTLSDGTAIPYFRPEAREGAPE